jgi:hypothetical protein
VDHRQDSPRRRRRLDVAPGARAGRPTPPATRAALRRERPGHAREARAEVARRTHRA